MLVIGRLWWLNRSFSLHFVLLIWTVFLFFLLSILSQTLVYKNIVRSSWVVLYKDIWHSSLSGMTSCLINIQYIYSVHKSKSDLVAYFLYIFVELVWSVLEVMCFVWQFHALIIRDYCKTVCTPFTLKFDLVLLNPSNILHHILILI